MAPPGILAVSSALHGDGKTAVAAGIARSLAMVGYRVLVLDATNQPSAVPHEHAANGTAASSLERVVRATPTGCDYVSLEQLGGDVSSSVAIGELFAFIRERYQYAVIDAGVLNGTALPMARGADGVVLALREGRAISEADGEAVELMNRLRARFLGVVATEHVPGDHHHSALTLLERLQLPSPGSNGVAAANGAAQPDQRRWKLFGGLGSARPLRATDEV